jgi:hypothetical protein
LHSHCTVFRIRSLTALVIPADAQRRAGTGTPSTLRPDSREAGPGDRRRDPRPGSRPGPGLRAAPVPDSACGASGMTRRPVALRLHCFSHPESHARGVGPSRNQSLERKTRLPLHCFSRRESHRFRTIRTIRTLFFSRRSPKSAPAPGRCASGRITGRRPFPPWPPGAGGHRGRRCSRGSARCRRCGRRRRGCGAGSGLRGRSRSSRRPR